MSKYYYTKLNAWIGNQLINNKLFNGKKILLVGESHYKTDDPNFTNWVINEQMESKGDHHPYFTKVKRILGCKDVSSKDFWNSVIFYNYIQAYLQNMKVVPPLDDREFWENSENNFKHLCEQQKPDLILSISKRLYQTYLPSFGSKNVELTERFGREIWNYPFKDKVSLCTWIHHPSSPYGNSILNDTELFVQEVLRHIQNQDKN